MAYTEIFEVVDTKTRDAKIPCNSPFTVIFSSFFLTKFNVKLQSYKFLSNLLKKSLKFVKLHVKITLTFF